MAVLDSWCGAPAKTGFGVVATISPGGSATLHVSTSQTLAGAVTVPMQASGQAGVYRATITGLMPGTRYWWGIAEGAGAAAQLGEVWTAPDGPASFSFWSSCCALTGSNHQVFDEIRGRAPRFGLHMGDLHYADIATNDPAAFHGAYDQVLRAARQGQLYRECPIVYSWDDHDYADNNSGYSSPARPAALSTYRQRVPHFPLPGEGVWQTFAYGRVRFIMLDVRSMRGKTAGSIIGAEQMAWVKSVLSVARESVVVISTGVPWIGTVGDTWADAPAERLELAEWLAGHGWKGRVIFTAGDAHSIAYDDGSNNPFGGLNAPVFQTAALDQTSSTKGGTYTRPPVLASNAGQYGMWAVTDTGGPQIEMALTAYSGGSALYTETLTFPARTGDWRRRALRLMATN